ncbi:MAG TPA: hypothetical protein VHT70_00825 [Candidatus Saccharimonadales bacterium]|jgi:hypothetical protein|nr:hypothetical protein [Candidatus Saccharimonadales bacterium]
MALFFSDLFEVDRAVLDAYGAYDISMATDLPLFIDPFLLYDSEGGKYDEWHEALINYLIFLRDLSAQGNLNKSHLNYYYGFPEVKENWLGFTQFGNSGHGLGKKFGSALNENLGRIFNNFGTEKVTDSGHLEKLCLIKEGVGKDSISDFTTNLIKRFLLEYTQAFAIKNIDKKHLRTFYVRRAYFDSSNGQWKGARYTLPSLGVDYVLLTPKDILTRDDTWINKKDLYASFEQLPKAINNETLRLDVSNHFYSQLDKKSKKTDRIKAAAKTIAAFPELIDYYISFKEKNAPRAHEVSIEKVSESEDIFQERLGELISGLKSSTNFYEGSNSYEECLRKVNEFKDYIENNDGYKVVQAAMGVVRSEEIVQLFFGLAWLGSSFDFNREVGNGRGDVDFKISKGSADKTLIEFKLASSSSLEKNLENQMEIYKKANRTGKGIRVIFVTDMAEATKVEGVLNKLKLVDKEDVIVVDCRADNKPSASKSTEH